MAKNQRIKLHWKDALRAVDIMAAYQEKTRLARARHWVRLAAKAAVEIRENAVLHFTEEQLRLMEQREALLPPPPPRPVVPKPLILAAAASMAAGALQYALAYRSLK